MYAILFSAMERNSFPELETLRRWQGHLILFLEFCNHGFMTLKFLRCYKVSNINLDETSHPKKKKKKMTIGKDDDSWEIFYKCQVASSITIYSSHQSLY
jgi:hypothetical protein